jgi:NADPH:quinone reductase-like Zn-dependent oxidoreductase
LIERPDAIPATMRATVLTGHGGLDKLVYREDVPTPQAADAEVLVRVGACGVNNTDVNTRTAWYDRVVQSGLSEDFGVRGRGDGDALAEAVAASWNTSTVTFPRIGGAAVAGCIVAVGGGIDRGRLGERVLVDPQVRDPTLPHRAQLVAYLGSERDGGFAEYVAVSSVNAHKVESDLSDEELATFPCSYDTAEEMLVRAAVAEGETVVVTGAAGGVGTALIQLSLIRGAKVVAVASAAKEARLRRLGAHEFVPREHPDLVDAVAELCGAREVDVVADVVGGPHFGGLLKMLRRGGRYTTAGAIAGPLQTIDLRDLIYKDLELYGVTCPTPETFARIVDLAQEGRLQPLLEAAYPLDRLADAQARLVTRQHVGKFVVVP